MNPAVSVVEFLRRTLAYPDWRGKILHGFLRGIFRIIPVRRRHIMTELEKSFPGHDKNWYSNTTSRVYDSFCWTIVEFLAAQNDPTLVDRMMTDCEGIEILHRLRDENKNCVLLTGHFANWEVSGAWLTRQGFPVAPAAREADDAEFSRLIDRYRENIGTHTIAKTLMGARTFLRAARDGKWICLLADQDAGRNATPVKFLGRTATMVEGPAVLSLATHLPLVPIWSIRLAPFKLKGVIREPLSTGEEARTPENIAALTEKANAVLEEMVRKDPAQWFWFHRRWKSGEKLDAVSSEK